MIDTHCHLTDERLASQLGQVLDRARSAGVAGMVAISTDIADAQACIEVARGKPQVRCTVGIHPNHAHEADLGKIPWLTQLQAAEEVVAMGEMGLDYHYGLQHRLIQATVFEQQLQIAVDTRRSVIVHCREAMDDCLSILKNFAVSRAVFHCFTGTAAEAQRVIDEGYWIGYTGVITFKKSEEQRAAVALTPLDRLLIETDAPYLSPEPMRKMKVNEPALVVWVAETVAKIKNLDIGAVDEITTRNAQNFFQTSWPSHL